MKKIHSPCLHLCWIVACLVFGTSGASANMESADEMTPEIKELLAVKERVLEFLVGSEAGGDLWLKAVKRGDDRTAEMMEAPFTPLVWENPDDDQFGELLADYCQDIRQLAESFANPASAYHHSQKVLARIEESLANALEHFNAETPRPGNWYHWLLRTPEYLGAIGLLLEKDLPNELRQRLLASLRHELDALLLDGSNAAVESTNHLYLALMEKDVDRLKSAAEHVFRTINCSTAFGILEDYSYLFHGRIPYAGSYGSGYSSNCAKFLYFMEGTQWTAVAEKRELIAKFLYEHARWYMVGSVRTFHISGRGYSELGGSGGLFGAMLLMTQVENSLQDALKGAVAQLMNEGVLPSPEVAIFASKIDTNVVDAPRGFRFWYCAEMGAYRSDNFHVGFRQYSNRVQDYEFLTLRGGDGWNLPYGFTNILRTGREWYNCDNERGLCPDIDMVHLPGTTARIGAEPLNQKIDISYTGYSLNFGTSPFSGGAGWDAGGVAGFILKPVFGDFVARKSLHFFPSGYWALGSGISADKQSRFGDLPIHTTVLQWVSPGKVAISGKRQFQGGMENSEKVFSDVRWLNIDQVGCVFAEPTTISIRRNNNAVTIWIDHGSDVTDGAYAYAVLPVASVEETKEFSIRKPVKPLRWNRKVHMVRDEERGADSLVFFEDGYSHGYTADRPVVVYHQSNEAGDMLAMQNPLHDGGEITLSCSLQGEVTFSDPEMRVSPRDEQRVYVSAECSGGRIYRMGTGDLGREATSVPREDLSAFRDFKVEVESDMEETVFTMHVPQEAVESGFELSLRGYKGHLIKEFGETDVIERLSSGVIRYKWNRKATFENAPQWYGETLNQIFGDFRIYLETPTRFAVNYFTIPAFDENGEVDEEAELPVDRCHPRVPHWD